jgi:predicted ATPase
MQQTIFPPAIRSIRIENLLSFGEGNPALELRPLNVLIGPNGSGKSNLIEVFGLLQSTGQDLSEPIRQGGGITEWLWKGDPGRRFQEPQLPASKSLLLH